MISVQDFAISFASILFLIGLLGLVLRNYNFKGWSLPFETTAGLTTLGLGITSISLYTLGHTWSATLTGINALLWLLLWRKPIP